MNEAMSPAVVPQTLTEQTCFRISEALAGRRRGPRVMLSFVGPAVVASIAYMDPGNFATNIQAGAGYGYSLLWVVAVANIVAMLFQAMSAKLGLVTGRNLAELCRESLPRRYVYGMWGLSEIAAMATDLAEFVGGAIGVSLLLHLPMMASMLVTGAVTFGLLQFERKGFRPLELVIAALVGVIGLSYLAELLIAPVHWPSVFLHTFKPSIPDSNALTISVGIIGATVMPHVLFLHSGLTQNRVTPRNELERSRLLKFSNIEVVLALGVAGLINMAMVIMASSAFHQGHSDIASIETAWHTLTPLLGGAAAGLFLAALIASGISSSVVGTMAGQMIMQGFAGLCSGGLGCRRDQGAGVEPGGIERCAAGADDRTAVVHFASRSDGHLQEQPADECCRRGRHARRAGFERRAAGSGSGSFALADIAHAPGRGERRARACLHLPTAAVRR
jgi:manganese transport protein